MKIKNNLPKIFYIFGILGLLNAITKTFSDATSDGMINHLIYYPFSYLPFSSVFYFIVSGILDISIIWFAIGYFVSLRNKKKDDIDTTKSNSYKIMKWSLIVLLVLFIVTVMFSAINFITNVK